MSIEVVGHVLGLPLGGTAKVILIGVANHAHPDGTEAYPSLARLCEYGHCSRSTARRTLAKLAADGWIISDGHGPQGQAKWRVAMERIGGGVKMTRGGVKTAEGGVIAVTPEPSLEPSNTLERASASAEPMFRVLFPLRQVAARKAGSLDADRALRACQDFPDRDHIGEAERFQTWWLAGKGNGRTVRDVNAAWRNWLKGAAVDSTVASRGRHLEVAPPEQTQRAAIAAVVELGRRRSTTADNASALLEHGGHERAAEWVDRVGWDVALANARRGVATGWAA